MPQSLNLIPEQEIHEQQKTFAVKLSTVLAIVAVLVVSGAAAYFLYSTTTLKKEIKLHDVEIERLRSNINGLASIEVTARNLGKKYSVLESVLGDRVYYSKLMRELRTRKPSEIVLRSFTLLKDGQISISGTAQTYITITTFANNLLEAGFAGGDSQLSGVFTSVILNQVDLSRGGAVEFSMNIVYDPAKLHYGK